MFGMRLVRIVFILVVVGIQFASSVNTSDERIKDGNDQINGGATNGNSMYTDEQIAALIKEVKDLKNMVKAEKAEREKDFATVNKDITGLNCKTNELMYRTAPVDGGYSTWSPYSFCDCGLKFRTRSCDSPAAQHGGRDCSVIGSSHEWKVCSNKTKCPELDNLALEKATQQSSTRGDDYKAEKAVDGDLTTYSQTKYFVAWWRVDMGKSAIVYKVRAYLDGDFRQVANTIVTIGNNVDGDMTACGTFKYESRQQRQGHYAYDVICTKPLVGRYVQVNKYTYNGYTLGMREFEAYGFFF